MSRFVHLDPTYLPDAIMNTICLIPAFFLNILIVIAAVSIRERYKHTIVCHCLLSIWSTFCNSAMYIIYIAALQQEVVISIEACSIFRHTLWVAPKGQLLLLAIDRYCTVCRQKPLPLKTLWLLYGSIPFGFYLWKILDFAFGDASKDEICTVVYRMSKTVHVGALVLWILIIMACFVNLRVLLYIKFKQRKLKDNKCIKRSKKSIMLERRLTIVYLMLTIVPFVQIVPAVVVSAVRELTGFNSKALWVVAYMLLNLTPLVQAILIIVSIRSIKRRVWGMFKNYNMPRPTPSNTAIFSTRSDVLKHPTKELAALLNTELIRVQSSFNQMQRSEESVVESYLCNS